MNARFGFAVAVAALALVCSTLSAQPRLPPVKPPLPGGGGLIGGGGVIGDAARLDRLPDLQMTRLASTGSLETRPDGSHALPVTLTVRNNGRASAGPFKIAAQAAIGRTQHLAGLTVPGAADPSFAWVPGPFLAGAESTLRAKVILPSTLYGDLLITTVADSRAEEEFIPAYGRVRESNEDNNVSAGLTLRIPVPIVPAGPAGHVVTGPRRSSDETWRMGVNRLTIEHKSESSGDEPYFVVIGFRAQLFRAGSATAFRNRHLRELADDRESGDVTIPSWMGSVGFPHVQRLTTDEFNSGTMPEVVGAVVIAMESDRTPWGDITGIFDRAQAAVQEQAERLIARGALDLSHPEASLKTAIDRVNAQLEPDFTESFRLAVHSIFDGDDKIGIGTMSFVAVNRDLEDHLRDTLGVRDLPRLKTSPWSKTFTGDGARWNVTGFAGKDRSVVE